MPTTLLDIPLDQIHSHKLALRENLDENNLGGLMNSIQRYGVIEPVIVTPNDSGFHLVVGRRRFEACRRLSMETIPAIVRRISKDRALELSYQSNLQIHPINLADEIDFLRKINIFHLPDEEAARRLGMNTEEISIARRLSRLSPPIREALRNGEIDERRALALTRLNRETEQARLFRYIQESNPPIDTLEETIDRVRSGEAPQI